MHSLYRPPCTSKPCHGLQRLNLKYISFLHIGWLELSVSTAGHMHMINTHTNTHTYQYLAHWQALLMLGLFQALLFNNIININQYKLSFAFVSFSVVFFYYSKSFSGKTWVNWSCGFSLQTRSKQYMARHQCQGCGSVHLFLDSEICTQTTKQKVLIMVSLLWTSFGGLVFLLDTSRTLFLSALIFASFFSSPIYCHSFCFSSSICRPRTISFFFFDLLVGSALYVDPLAVITSATSLLSPGNIHLWVGDWNLLDMSRTGLSSVCPSMWGSLTRKCEMCHFFYATRSSSFNPRTSTWLSCSYRDIMAICIYINRHVHKFVFENDLLHLFYLNNCKTCIQNKQFKKNWQIQSDVCRFCLPWCQNQKISKPFFSGVRLLTMCQKPALGQTGWCEPSLDGNNIAEPQGAHNSQEDAEASQQPWLFITPWKNNNLMSVNSVLMLLPCKRSQSTTSKMCDFSSILHNLRTVLILITTPENFFFFLRTSLTKLLLRHACMRETLCREGLDQTLCREGLDQTLPSFSGESLLLMHVLCMC